MGKTTGLSCISFLPNAKHFHVPRESHDSIYRKTGMEPLLDHAPAGGGEGGPKGNAPSPNIYIFFNY